MGALELTMIPAFFYAFRILVEIFTRVPEMLYLLSDILVFLSKVVLFVCLVSDQSRHLVCPVFC